MKNKFAKISDHYGLVRDLDTQAVLNTDVSVVRQHEKRIADLMKESIRETEIQNMKTELGEIRLLLKSLGLGKL